jgi:hypothetical protein
VKRWKRKFKTGDRGVEDQDRSGRPHTLSGRQEKKLVSRCRGKRKRSSRVVAEELTDEGSPVSHVTVQRVLKDSSLKPFRRRKVLKISEPGKRKRVEFAKAELGRDWATVLMTDEADFPITPSLNPRNDVVWAKSPKEVPPYEKQKWELKLRIWAGVSARGKTKLHFWTGTLDGPAYRRILKAALGEMKAIFCATPWTFQHDGASAHKDHVTNDWLTTHVPHFISSGPKGRWPPTSGDINWAENIWGILEDDLSTYETLPENLRELKKRLLKAWNDLPLATLQHAAAGMRARLQRVIDGKGAALRDY